VGLAWEPAGFPVEFLSLSDEPGVRLRSTVSEFGPVLFSKILGLNDTQSGIISVAFKFCDDRGLPLVDLKDVKQVIRYLTDEGKESVEKEYGRMSSTSAGTILRKVLEIEQEGAEAFFGERSFDVEDMLRTDPNGRGVISILRLGDIQNRPRLFSTFMLALLAEVYARFPEVGDPEKPKLVIVIDEAHLVFQEASKALLEQLETIVRLIRSKGVGVIFCTQSPADIPAAVLGQLGLKIQHALRAFTANDRKAIRLAAENYPESEFYDTGTLLTSLGIGEALVTVLTEKGTPSPLAHTLLCAPGSRMGILTPQELASAVSASPLAAAYAETVDRESAFEMLSRKLEASGAPNDTPAPPASRRPEKTTLEKVLADPMTRQIGRTVAREVARGLLGVLGLGGARKSTRSFF
jgi:DNA helicase HerA-like ATPase